jgi:hypothetical protein
MPAITPAELRRILDKHGLTLAELARICHVHPVSARRWGSKGVPAGPAAVLIQLLDEYDSTMEMLHLLRSPENARRLSEGVSNINAGKTVEFDPRR